MRRAAALALVLATSLILPAGLPACAEKASRWEKEGQEDRKPDNGAEGGKGNGSDKTGGASTDLLQAGVTAAAVAGLLGPAASQILSVGAKPLAPRIAKDIVRGKKLPPGIGKQAVPPTLLHRLPGLDGHEWARIGTDLVLVAVATQVVTQVITDEFS